MKKRILLALAAGVTVTGAVAASAASLGGITSTSLGADDTVVASCDTDGIGAGYTTVYESTTTAYNTTAVNLTGVDAACDKLAYSVTLADITDASLNTTTGTLTVDASGNATITLSKPVAAEAVEHLSAVISG
jgi:hypothetical protein